MAKVRLTRGEAVVDIAAIGRFVYVDEAGTENRHGHFDDATAREAAAALVAKRIADGWREPDAVVAARDAAARDKAALAADLAAVAQAARTSAADALKRLAGPALGGPAFATLLARAQEVSVAGAHRDDVTVRFAGGATLAWVRADGPSRHPVPSLARVLDHTTRLWLYVDEAARARNDHQLFFADGAEPPEGDSELHGTPFEGEDVSWFLEELPWDRYWFIAPDGQARCWQMDGGLRPEPVAGAVGDLLAARIVAVLDGRN